jgi:outer membrane protein
MIRIYFSCWLSASCFRLPACSLGMKRVSSLKMVALLTIFYFSINFSHAQSGILENYINEGLKNNLQLQREQLNVDKSLSVLSQSRSLFFPQVSANASYSLASGGRTITVPVGDLMNPVYTTLNQLTGTTNFPQIENSTEQFLPNNFHDTKLRFIQPLFNSDIYYGYKAQKELISVQQAQRNAYENELRYSITSSYFQYLQSEEAIQVLENTKKFVGELVQLNQKLVANDKVTRDVLLSSEYEYSKVDQQIAEATKNNQTAKSYFNFLLNRDWSAEIVKDTLLVAGLGKDESVESLTNTAWEKRQEIKQLEGAARANHELVNMAGGNKYLPKLSAVADLGYQGFAYKFNSEQQYALVQFNLTWDLFKGGEKKEKARQSQIDQQVLENRLAQTKKQIELEVIQANQELIAAEKAFLSSQSGVRSAERAFQIINAKYKEGQALLIELLDAQNKLTLSKLSLSVNRYEVLRREAGLQKAVAGI